MKEKLLNLIKSTDALGEFDKYFWLTKINEFTDEITTEVYEIILRAEKEILSTQINSISQIKSLITHSYPELEKTFLPEFKPLFEKFKSIEEEITVTHIEEIKYQLKNQVNPDDIDIDKNNRYFDLVKQIEDKALQNISTLSHLDSLPTIGQTKEKIHAIHEKIRELDLAVESRTFAFISKVTNVKLPQLNDRILLAFKFLYEAIERQDEDSFEFVRKNINLIFEWDDRISKLITQILPDLQNYIQLKKDTAKLSEFSKEIIQRYSFGYASYEESLKQSVTSISSEFNLLIPFVDKLGPLISMYDAINNIENKDVAKFDSTVSVLILILNLMEINTIYILDFIPNIFRAIARSTGLGEEDILKMEFEEVVKIGAGTTLGKVLTRLAYNIIRKKKERIENSSTGRRLWIELVQNNFWDNIYFSRQYGNLELIAKSK